MGLLSNHCFRKVYSGEIQIQLSELSSASSAVASSFGRRSPKAA